MKPCYHGMNYINHIFVQENLSKNLNPNIFDIECLRLCLWPSDIVIVHSVIVNKNLNVHNYQLS